MDVRAYTCTVQHIQALHTGVKEGYGGCGDTHHNRVSSAVEVHHLKGTHQGLSLVARLFHDLLVDGRSGCHVRCGRAFFQTFPDGCKRGEGFLTERLLDPRFLLQGFGQVTATLLHALGKLVSTHAKVQQGLNLW